MKKFLLSQSLAVRTFVLPEVNSIIENVKPTFDSVIPYTTYIKEWLKPIIDLSEFYVYPMNGITEGLNWWYYKEERSVIINNGDYQWIANKKGSNNYIKYLSVPSAIDGNFVNIPIDVPVALDLAYVGSTKIKKLDISSNVEFVFFSLSKSFGISNIRTGWLFTKHEDKKLNDLIYSAKYYNYYANKISEKVIQSFSIDHIHNRLNNKQIEICEKLNLTPSDSVWLATTNDIEYQKFRRHNNTARLCLSGVYK